MKQNINSASICIYIISAGRVDWLNEDNKETNKGTNKLTNKQANKQTNKQTVLTPTSLFFTTKVKGLYFITTVSAFGCRRHVR